MAQAQREVPLQEKSPEDQLDFYVNELLQNLQGSLDKLEDAAADRYGQTWENAGRDIRQALPYLIRKVRELREAVRSS